jgi:hypothetical protein
MMLVTLLPVHQSHRPKGRRLDQANGRPMDNDNSCVDRLVYYHLTVGVFTTTVVNDY